MIVIGWSELPNYAVDCINYLNLNDKLIVLTDNKKAKYLIKNANVKIVDLSKNYTWESIGILNAKYFFFTGWNNRAFISLAREKKTKNICLIDNILKKNFRQFLGKFYFKLFFNNIFDAVFVPGKDTKEFVKYLGFKKLILEGMYSCNDKVFKNKKNIIKRKFDFIFVGKFIERKNLSALIQAFKNIQKIYPKSKMLLVGGKNYKEYHGIKTIPHTNSKNVAGLMNNSKCLVLPSLEEHWGVVVHESICCGCVLILSSEVGSKREFLKKNGYKFKPEDTQELFNKMRKIINLTKNDLKEKSKLSSKISKKRSLKLWKKQFFKFIKKIN